MKVGFLALRQATKPFTKRLVERAKVGHTRSLCIALGRFSLGLSGAIIELSQQEEVKAAQDRAKEDKKDEDPKRQHAVSQEGNLKENSGTTSASPSPASSLPDWEKEVRTASPRSRSLLESISYGPLPKKRYDSSVFLDPNRAAGEAINIFILYPYKSMWELFRNRFLAPYPVDKLVDAGADLLVEVMAFMILSLILTYELTLQFRATARKEAILQARMEHFERQIARLEKAQGLPITTFSEDEYPEHLQQEVIRFQWIRNGVSALQTLSVRLGSNIISSSFGPEQV